MNRTNTTAAAIALLLAAGAAIDARAQSMLIKNTYADKDVWITTYQAGQQLQSFCVDKGQSKAMSHVQYHNGFKVRAEVMTGPACKGTKICDTDMGVESRQHTSFKDPGRGIHIHQHASVPNRCYISWTEVKAHHKMTVRNTYKDRYVWVTSYDYMSTAGQKKQIHSGCVNPGADRTWSDDRYQNGNYIVRAEVMTGAECKGNKVCDTDANPLTQNRDKANFVRQNATNANKCYIDWK